MKLTEEQKKIIEWESLLRLDKVVMVAMLPIFAVVAGLEHILLWFKKIGWNYVVSSVIICVVVSMLIYVELIYAIVKQ